MNEIQLDEYTLTYYDHTTYQNPNTHTVGVSLDGKAVGIFSLPSDTEDWQNARFYNVNNKRGEIGISHPTTLADAVKISVENYQK